MLTIVSSTNPWDTIQVHTIAKEEEFEVPEGVILEDYPNLTKKEKYLNYLFTKKFGPFDPPGSRPVIKCSEEADKAQDINTELFLTIFLPKEIKVTIGIEGHPLDHRVTDLFERATIIKHLFFSKPDQEENIQSQAGILVQATQARQIYCSTQIHKDLCTQAKNFIRKNKSWVTPQDICFLELVLEEYRAYLIKILKVTEGPNCTYLGYREEAFNALRKLVCDWTIQSYEKPIENLVLGPEELPFNFWDLKKCYSKAHNKKYSWKSRTFAHIESHKSYFLEEPVHKTILGIIDSELSEAKKFYKEICAKKGRRIFDRYISNPRPTFFEQIGFLYNKKFRESKVIHLKYSYYYWEENSNFKWRREQALKHCEYKFTSTEEEISKNIDELALPQETKKRKLFHLA